MLEARVITILTDYKPLIYAFKQNQDKDSPCQSMHLSYFSEFTTDIRRISGKENFVADTHSRVDACKLEIDYEALARLQINDAEMRFNQR